MTTTSRWCALCREDYLEEVEICTACLVPLVDERPLRPDEVGERGDEQLGYDYGGADPEQRLAIDVLLRAAGIDHSWDGASLVVGAGDEAAVDRLLDDAGAEAIDDGPPAEWLEDDADVLVYDLSDWTHDQRSELVERLAEKGVQHVFDEEGDLVVGVDAERVVDDVIDGIDFPDQLAAEPDDVGAEEGSLAGVESMSALFVAADRLAHDPDETAAILAMADAADQVEGRRPPYGFSPAAWTAIQEQAVAVVATLDDPDAEPDDVVAAATTLRATLRPLV